MSRSLTILKSYGRPFFSENHSPTKMVRFSFHLKGKVCVCMRVRMCTHLHIHVLMQGPEVALGSSLNIFHFKNRSFGLTVGLLRWVLRIKLRSSCLVTSTSATEPSYPV